MAKKSRGATGTPATVALARAGVAHTLHPYDHDAHETHFGEETVRLLGLDPARVFKTLLAMVDGRTAVGIVPVAGQLDLKALAAALGGKRAQMAEPAYAEKLTGMVVGGISPLGQRTALPMVIDASALDHATIFVSGGRRGLQVELAPGDLIGLTGAMTAQIGR